MTMMTKADHNDARWLVVRREENARGQGFLAGWYVVRICPCHDGERVCLPQDSEAEAERVRRVILGIERAQRRPEPQEWAPSPVRPAAVLPGQVWRRNRHRNGRYFQVLRVAGGEAEIAPVARAADGQWVRLMTGRQRRINLRRMTGKIPPSRDTWPYTCIEE